MAEYNKLTPELIEELKGIVGEANCYVGDDISADYSHDEMPIYGEQMRDIRKSYDSLLNKYAEQLSVIYNCSKDITYPIVLLYISAILDYAVWEEKEKLESQVEYIYQLLLKEKGW